jgi:putative ABC transport system permease protein
VPVDRGTTGLAGSRLSLGVADSFTLVAAQQSDDDNQSRVSYPLVAMPIGCAVISLVNTLVLATAERRREFTLQRLAGSTRGHMLRMTTVEALLTALTGAILGGLVAVGALVPFSSAALGSSTPLGPLWILLAVLAMVLALTLATNLLSTTVALHPPLATSSGPGQ